MIKEKVLKIERRIQDIEQEIFSLEDDIEKRKTCYNDFDDLEDEINVLFGEKKQLISELNELNKDNRIVWRLNYKVDNVNETLEQEFTDRKQFEKVFERSYIDDVCIIVDDEQVIW